MSGQLSVHSQQLDAMRLRLLTVTSKQVAFLQIDDTARHMPPPEVIFEYAVHFYNVFAAGAGGAIALAVAKGAAGEIGKAAGAKLVDLWERWRGGAVKRPTNEGEATAQLAQATTALAEAVTALSSAVHEQAMGAGEAQLAAHLREFDFPASRARTLAADIRAIAESPLHG